MLKILIIFLFIPNLCFGLVTFGSANTDALTCGTGTNVLDNTAAFSFCAWVYPTSDNSASQLKLAFKNKTGAGGMFFYILATKTLGFYRDTNNFDFVLTGNSNAINLNSRQLICATGPATGTVANHHIYVNNAEISYASTHDGTGGLVVNSTGTVFIAGNGAGGTQSLNGNLHHVAIWNAQLTTSQLTSVYNGGNLNTNWEGIQHANLQGDWWLTECKNGATCSGTNQFVDISGSGNHCAAAGSPKGLYIQNSVVSGSSINGSTVD